mgnify:CR=1 FL=1
MKINLKNKNFLYIGIILFLTVTYILSFLPVFSSHDKRQYMETELVNQKYRNSIPEIQADHIFAGWTEAMGYIGVVIYFVLLIIFAVKGYKTIIIMNTYPTLQRYDIFAEPPKDFGNNSLSGD